MLKDGKRNLLIRNRTGLHVFCIQEIGRLHWFCVSSLFCSLRASFVSFSIALCVILVKDASRVSCECQLCIEQLQVSNKLLLHEQRSFAKQYCSVLNTFYELYRSKIVLQEALNTGSGLMSYRGFKYRPLFVVVRQLEFLWPSFCFSQ